jgi:outer membrane immunogenic protein
MKKAFAALVLFAFPFAFLFGLLPQAQAADIQPGYAPYAPPPPYRWTGPYVGFNLGYQWGDISNNPTSPSGIAGGIQAGYNWQFGNLVLGVETDINLSGASDTFAPWQFSNPWFGTLRGRLGYAVNNFMIYGTGGLAYGGIQAEVLGLTESKTRTGWTVGGGAEVGLTPAWSVKLEYLYMSFADSGYWLTQTNNGFDSSLVRFGVNYRF